MAQQNIKPNLDTAKTIIFGQAQMGAKLKDLLDQYVCQVTGQKLNDEQKRIVGDHVASELEYYKSVASAEVEDPSVLVDPTGHEEWYQDWVREAPQRYYWDRLKAFVGQTLRTNYGAESAGIIVRSIDQASDKIIDRLEKPSRQRFETKGLVLGYVQSGKTANFTAVIAKAADAGYRLVVVLTGIHDNLRAQTQQRLDRELTGEPVGETTHVELPILPQHRWLRLTRGDADFDPHFTGPLAVEARFQSPQLAVIKKNCTVLRKFLSWVKQAPPNVRASLPLLLIDDEADQASIDINYTKDTNPSSTNRLIRTILGQFSKHAYIGYTATPFANVLIDVRTNTTDWGRDLYPRNFIVSLPRPANYVGADSIFVNGHADLYVREVPTTELPMLLVPPRGNASDYPRSITNSFEQALLSFCLAGAARRLRGQAKSPSTMLIHTSPRQESHARMKDLTEAYWRSLSTRLQDRTERPKLLKKLEDLWTNDFVPVSKKLSPNQTPHKFKDLLPHLLQFVAEVQVFELNCATDDELNYTRHPTIKVVAIGGNKLSRGLTLEGLVTSFYLRASRQYDTLLQMGRWFGYRHGYEDLTRVYTTDNLANWFEDLALVEREIRQEISRYEAEGLTPAELAVRIRDHQRLRVTAPNKMGAAANVQSSFSGSMRQTIWFPLNKPAKLTRNLDAGKTLIGKIGPSKFKKVARGYLAKKADGDAVLAFLKKYEFATAQEIGTEAGLNGTTLSAYVQRRQKAGELQHWNVAVVSKAGAKDSAKGSIDFGGLKVTPSVRNRRDAGSLRLGVLSNPDELRIDRASVKDDLFKGRGPNEPLLILYYISKDSKPQPGRARTGSTLVPLFEGFREKEDVLGLVFLFPESKQEPYGYIAQQL